MEISAIEKHFRKNGFIGLAWEDFNKIFINSDDFEKTTHNDSLRVIGDKARLIPIEQKQDERFITSVFMSSLMLIKEFKETLFKSIGVNTKIKKIQCFTEMSIYDPSHRNLTKEEQLKRFDGVVIIGNNTKIESIVVFEMKIKKQSLIEDQILEYSDICNKLNISNMVTVTNDFVTYVTDSPVYQMSFMNNKTSYKGIHFFHFSWTYILTIGKILLLENGNDIKDEDQRLLLNEVCRYLKDSDLVMTFDKIDKQNWITVSNDNTLANNCAIDSCYTAIVNEWIQEEKDLALKLSINLSRKTFTNVSVYHKKNETMDDRKKTIFDTLKATKYLETEFDIPKACSKLKVKYDIKSKHLLVSFKVKLKKNDSYKKKIMFIRNQYKKVIKEYNKRNLSNLSSNMLNQIEHMFITQPQRGTDIVLKSSELLDVAKTEDKLSELFPKNGNRFVKDPNIKEYILLLNYSINSAYKNNTNLINEIEKAVINFYELLMQYFSNPVETKKAPQIPMQKNTKQDDIVMDNLEDNDI